MLINPTKQIKARFRRPTMKAPRTVLILVAVLFALLQVNQCKLYQVLSAFRHGARYHINSYYDGNDTKALWGELSAVGMRQHQNLGKFLRKQYIDKLGFLSPSYNRTEIEVYSTFYNRTIQSALSQMYGLYPPGTGPKLTYVSREYHIPPYSNKTDIDQQNYALPNAHQPIPVKFNGQLLLQACKNQQQEIQKNYQIKKAEFESMDLTYGPFVDSMADLFKIDKKTFNLSKMGFLYDTLNCDKYLGRPFPSQFKDQDFQNLRHIAYWKHLFQHSLDLARAQNSRKFQKVIDTFDARIQSPTGYNLKWVFLSIHDTHMAPIQYALNISSSVCIEERFRKGESSALNCENGPDFASSIIIELHSDNQKDFYVMVRFNGKYIYLCEKKETKCSYTDFKNRLKKVIMNDSDIEKMCGNKVTVQPVKGYSEFDGQHVEPEHELINQYLNELEPINQIMEE